MKVEEKQRNVLLKKPFDINAESYVVLFHRVAEYKGLQLHLYFLEEIMMIDTYFYFDCLLSD